MEGACTAGAGGLGHLHGNSLLSLVGCNAELQTAMAVGWQGRLRQFHIEQPQPTQAFQYGSDADAQQTSSVLSACI